MCYMSQNCIALTSRGFLSDSYVKVVIWKQIIVLNSSSALSQTFDVMYGSVFIISCSSFLCRFTELHASGEITCTFDDHIWARLTPSIFAEENIEIAQEVLGYSKFF